MTKTRQWTVFTAVAVIVVLLAGWMLLVKPQKSKASNLEAQATTQQQANALLNTQIAALESEQRQLPQQQKELQKFATQVPSDVSEPTVIRQLSAAASGAGVDLVSMTPGSATVVNSEADGSTTLTTTDTTSPLVQLPVALGVTGSYANMESFFLSLEKLPRALLVTGWSLCPDSNAAGSTSASTGSTGGVSCTPPATPANKTLPAGTVGGTLSAVVFYAPPGGTTTSAAGSTTTPTTTTPSTTTTPAPSTSTAATPSPTVASSAPAN
jgi:Tfp pilus assembly protein PilO